MINRLRVSLTFVIAIALIRPTVARSQDGAAMDMTGMGIYAMEDAVMEAASETVKGQRSTSPTKKPSAPLTYKPSVEQRQRNQAQFIAKSKAKDPKAAAELERLFASTDVIGAMGKAIAPYGLRTDNVADAYTTWWINAWLASRGRTDTPDKRVIEAVRAQATAAFGRTSGLLSATDAIKQEIAETHLIQAALIDGYMTGAKGDPTLLRKIAAGVRQSAHASGLDLDAMNLTERGFVPAAR